MCNTLKEIAKSKLRNKSTTKRNVCLASQQQVAQQDLTGNNVLCKNKKAKCEEK